MKKIATYHGACLDGSTAAAVLKMRYGADVKLFPVKSSLHEEVYESVENELNALDEKCELFVLDNSFFLEKFAELDFEKITIIDHHAGAKEFVESVASTSQNIEYNFDNSKSGASLAWQYFFPEKNLPKFIWHIEDGDIWKMEDEYRTNLVSSYCSIYLDQIDKFIEFINGDIEEIYKNGEIANDYKNMIVDYYIRNAQALHLKIGEHKIKAYNVAAIRPIVSDFGNIISKRVGEPVVMFKIFGDIVNLSFRSASENFKPYPVDLAQSLGGNGHKLASGAAMKLQDFIEALEEEHES